ncbi:MAG: hypothetical protein IJZ93_03410 [Clostridia bacterium]|nr:hypothetical protein [Clostridia bacterium]
MDNKESIIEMLHKKQPQEVQEQGISLALKEENLEFILEVCNDVNYANNCAKIFSELNYDRSARYFEKLFLWIEDANKVGVDIVVKYLSKSPAKLLYSDFLKAAERDFDVHYNDLRQQLENFFELLQNPKKDKENILKHINKENIYELYNQFSKTPEYELKDILRKEGTMYWSLVEILEENNELLNLLKSDNRDFIQEMIKDAEN